MSIRTFLVLLCATSLVLVDGVTAQPSIVEDTLGLDEVHARAAAGNPMVVAAGARVDALRAVESAAALPPDPQLRLGVMNASLPGFETDMPASMAPALEVMQMVPLPGKLGLAGDIARAGTAIARAEAAETGWMVRTRATMAYYEIYLVDRQVATMTSTLRLLEDFAKVARAMYASGEGRQADVLRSSVEIARMRAELERMAAMRVGAVARLNAALGRPAETAVAAVAPPPESEHTLPTATLREWATESSPTLDRGRLEVRRATARMELARKELWPDLTLGLQYGQRSGETGTERMGSAMVGFSLPVFAGRRQLKMRQEAAAMERMAEAELDDVVVEIDARIGELLAEIDRARTLMTLYRSEILPQAAAAVQSAFASYRVGAVDFMTLVDAQMSVNRFDRELAELQAEHAQALAELEMTIGRELPSTRLETRGEE